MIYHATADFWACYEALPVQAKSAADKAFELLKADPNHPSLQLKKIDRFWSARAGLRYRALAVESDDGLVWFWIGSHASYDRLIR